MNLKLIAEPSPHDVLIEDSKQDSVTYKLCSWFQWWKDDVYSNISYK